MTNYLTVNTAFSLSIFCCFCSIEGCTYRFRVVLILECPKISLKIWPKVIELKPKKIKGTVKLMAIFQCLEFIDDERKVHKIDFLTSEFFQGKEYFIGIIPYKKFDKLSGNIVVLEDLSNGEYQFADFIIAEKIYQKIQKEMKCFEEKYKINKT